jgi:hypothetical protein
LKKSTLAFALSEQWVSALFGQGVALFFNFFLEKKKEKNRAGLLADPSRLDS